MKTFMLVFCACAISLTVGCATTSAPPNVSGIAPRVVDPGQKSLGEGTGVGSQDLQAVTDKMARSIMSTPAIAKAAAPPVIGLLPVVNDTRFPITKDIFNKRIKAMLNTQCRGSVQFVARDRIESVEREREMKRQGMVGSSGQGVMAGVDFFLTGELTGLSQASSSGQSDYILYTFRLINAETGIEEWEDFSEIKKEGVEDAAYR